MRIFNKSFEHSVSFQNAPEQFSFVDPFNDGKLLDQPINPYALNYVPIRQLDVARPLNVFLRMASNLIEVGRRDSNISKSKNIMRNGLELGTLISDVS